MESINGKVMAYRSKYPKVCEVPFNSSNKYQVTHVKPKSRKWQILLLFGPTEQVSVHECDETPNSKYLLAIKGAPERILDCCSTILVNGQELPINDKVKTAFNAAYLDLGGRGERVLGELFFIILERLLKIK